MVIVLELLRGSALPDVKEETYPQQMSVLIGHEVNGDAPTAEATRTANAMNVLVALNGQFVVDHNRNLGLNETNEPNIGTVNRTDYSEHR